MELWQMAVMGGVRLADGNEAKVLTGVDDHSHYCSPRRRGKGQRRAAGEDTHGLARPAPTI
jgi:hypothetical protein